MSENNHGSSQQRSDPGNVVDADIASLAAAAEAADSDNSGNLMIYSEDSPQRERPTREIST